jgi:glycosyltransferase involved in cell wall biosynthesis
MSRILIEGWRFAPTSFAIVNQFQCLELMRRDGVEIYHRDVPYWSPDWQPVYGLLDPVSEERLRTMPAPEQGQHFDATLRMGCPFDFSSSGSTRTTVFATCEFGHLSDQAVAGNIPLRKALSASTAQIITPSRWSRDGLVNSGADADRIAIIPHGVDPSLFYPLSTADRKALRRKLGWEGHFVILNISAMTPNKGIRSLLGAFREVAARHQSVRLVLKGLDTWFNSASLIGALADKIPADEMQSLGKRIAYIGDAKSFADMAAYYQAADLYVAPYMGEGFNMPVLEAVACGLPVICTGGGPTDDFTTDDFSCHIDSILRKSPNAQGIEECFLVPDQRHLVELMHKVIEDRDWMERARRAGPAYVLSAFTWEHVVDKLLPVVLGEAGS